MFHQPSLHYDVNALSPVISQETMNYHYGKHEKAYIDNLNALIAGTEYSDKTLEEIIKTSKGAIFNNASQAWNHIFYFEGFSSKDGGDLEPGQLRLKIEEVFGSFEEFKKEFEAKGLSLFGSGWVWLSKDSSGNLIISQGSNADNPLTQGLKPILCFDVWEHAYYLDYQNRRLDYLHNLWNIVDWSVIEGRYID